MAARTYSVLWPRDDRIIDWWTTDDDNAVSDDDRSKLITVKLQQPSAVSARVEFTYFE
jgi:hypothetical protein